MTRSKKQNLSSHGYIENCLKKWLKDTIIIQFIDTVYIVIVISFGISYLDEERAFFKD